MMTEVEEMYPGFGGRYNLLPTLAERARALVFTVPDGGAGEAAAGLGADEARVGATRSVMSYLIAGAQLDPSLRGSMWRGRRWPCGRRVAVTKWSPVTQRTDLLVKSIGAVPGTAPAVVSMSQ
jgi:hypothetical protein